MKKILLFLITIITIITLHSCNNNNSKPYIIYNTDTLRHFTVINDPIRNLIFIKVTINGEDAYFLLDSGASFSVLDINQSSKYDFLPLETRYTFGGIGGINKLYFVFNIKSFTIDNNKFNQIFYGSDINNVVAGIEQSNGIQILGILGSDFFNAHDVILDYGKNMFYIQK